MDHLNLKGELVWLFVKVWQIFSVLNEILHEDWSSLFSSLSIFCMHRSHNVHNRFTPFVATHPLTFQKEVKNQNNSSSHNSHLHTNQRAWDELKMYFLFELPSYSYSWDVIVDKRKQWKISNGGKLYELNRWVIY